MSHKNFCKSKASLCASDEMKSDKNFHYYSVNITRYAGHLAIRTVHFLWYEVYRWTEFAKFYICTSCWICRQISMAWFVFGYQQSMLFIFIKIFMEIKHTIWSFISEIQVSTSQEEYFLSLPLFCCCDLTYKLDISMIISKIWQTHHYLVRNIFLFFLNKTHFSCNLWIGNFTLLTVIEKSRDRYGHVCSCMWSAQANLETISFDWTLMFCRDKKYHDCLRSTWLMKFSFYIGFLPMPPSN